MSRKFFVFSTFVNGVTFFEEKFVVVGVDVKVVVFD